MQHPLHALSGADKLGEVYSHCEYVLTSFDSWYEGGETVQWNQYNYGVKEIKLELDSVLVLQC